MKRTIVSLAVAFCVGAYAGEASAQVGIILGPVVGELCDASPELCEVVVPPLQAVCAAVGPELCAILFGDGPVVDDDNDSVPDDLEDQVCPQQIPGLEQICCPHGPRSRGAALHESCSECTATVCEMDSYCCQYEWDNACKVQAQDFCN